MHEIVHMNGRQTVTKMLMLGVAIVLLTSAATIAQAQPTTPQTSLNDAYKAILDASTAGANTSQLVSQLNHALNLTAQAQIIKNDPQTTQSLTNQAQALIQNVTQQAKTAQQSSQGITPVIPIAAAALALSGGVCAYFFGPTALWKAWFKLRRNHRIKLGSLKGNSTGMVITAQQVCAVVLVVMVVVAFVSVSGLFLPRSQGETFSELGILGPNLKLGDYPAEVVASETVHLYVYVGNHMDKPMFYTVMVKLGNNQTIADPANTPTVSQFMQVVSSNQTWIFPASLTLTQTGMNQRLIFELWVYNETANQVQYGEQWGQIWLNVTAPAA